MMRVRYAVMGDGTGITIDQLVKIYIKLSSTIVLIEQSP